MNTQNVQKPQTIDVHLVIHDDVELTDERVNYLAKLLLWKMIKNSAESGIDVKHVEDSNGKKVLAYVNMVSPKLKETENIIINVIVREDLKDKFSDFDPRLQRHISFPI